MGILLDSPSAVITYGITINIIIWDDSISEYKYTRFTVDYTLQKQEKDTFYYEQFGGNSGINEGNMIITLDDLENGHTYDNCWTEC